MFYGSFVPRKMGEKAYLVNVVGGRGWGAWLGHKAGRLWAGKWNETLDRHEGSLEISVPNGRLVWIICFYCPDYVQIEVGCR